MGQSRWDVNIPGATSQTKHLEEEGEDVQLMCPCQIQIWFSGVVTTNTHLVGLGKPRLPQLRVETNNIELNSRG